MSGPAGMPQFLPPAAAPPPGGGPARYAAAPPPAMPGWSTPAAPQVPPRPGVVTAASSLAVTGSLQWLCGLSLAWVAATAGVEWLGSAGQTGAAYHALNRFHYRLVEGLAVPLYLVPVAALVFGLLLPSRLPWVRLAHTVVGAVALAGSAWMLRAHLLWWILLALYLGVATSIVWTRSATAWYRQVQLPQDRGPGEPRS